MSRDPWPTPLPKPNELLEYKLNNDSSYEYGAPQGDLVWLEYQPSYGNYGWAYLCYWPGESRENHDGTRGGTPVRLSFRCRRDAREWYTLNITHELCPHCLERIKAHGSNYCGECRDALAELRQLEARYRDREDRRKGADLIQERISELRRVLDDRDFTIADKAAVLDRLLAESDVEEEGTDG